MDGDGGDACARKQSQREGDRERPDESLGALGIHAQCDDAGSEKSKRALAVEKTRDPQTKHREVPRTHEVQQRARTVESNE